LGLGAARSRFLPAGFQAGDDRLLLCGGLFGLALEPFDDGHELQRRIALAAEANPRIDQRTENAVAQVGAVLSPGVDLIQRFPFRQVDGIDGQVLGGVQRPPRFVAERPGQVQVQP
jgi:hypothetical protein